jgi:hypothetical protein
MPIASLRVPQPLRLTGRLSVSQRDNGRTASWSGSVSTSEPIVAMCFLQVGDQLYWARSPTRDTTELPISLLLAAARETGPGGLYVTWSIGACQTQLGVEGIAKVQVPNRIEREIVVGESFHFADVAPSISLLGLVLPKAQVKGKRNHLWSLKDEYLGELSPAWRGTMSRGRTGCVVLGIADGA